MKILITGGVGYIGSNIVLAAIVAGHSVLIYDNLSNSGEATVSFWALEWRLSLKATSLTVSC